MKWIIDRIEDKTAVCETENGLMIDVSLNALPENVKEGDVLSITADAPETDNRKQQIDRLMDDLFID